MGQFKLNNIRKKQVYTITDVGEMMSVDRATVFRWITRGVTLPVSGMVIKLEALLVGVPGVGRSEYRVIGSKLREFLEQLGCDKV